MLRIGIGFGLNRGGVLPPPPPPSTDFIIKVKTDNAGTSEDNQFTLPCFGSGYDFTATWDNGDTTTHTGTPGNITFTRPTVGEHTLTISGTFPRIFFNNADDKSKLIETVNFGDVGWTSMSRAFLGCNNMVITPTCTGVMPSGSYDRAWANCTSLSSFPALDLSGGTNFSQSWFNCTSLSSFPAIDLSGGTDFGNTWNGCSSMVAFNATALGSGSYTNTWRDCSSLSSFPALDLSGGTDFQSTWNGLGVMTSFATRLFYNMTNGGSCFNNTTLPTSDWSDILVTQRANNVNTGVTFHGGNSKYNPAGGVARGELVTIQSWSIIDGGAE